MESYQKQSNDGSEETGIILAAPQSGALATIQQAAYAPLTKAQEEQAIYSDSIGGRVNECMDEDFASLPPSLTKDADFKRVFARDDLVVADGDEVIVRAGGKLLVSAVSMGDEAAEDEIIRMGARHKLSAQQVYNLAAAWRELKHRYEIDDGDGLTPPDLCDEDADHWPDAEAVEAKLKAAWAANAARDAAKGAAIPPETPAADLMTISKMLKVEVAGWIQYGVDRPEYAVQLADGRSVVMGTTASVLGQTHFRKRLYAATGIAFPKFSDDDWFNLCNALGRVRRIAPKMNEERVNVFDCFGDYVIAKLGQERVQSIIEGRPFVGDGRLYVRAEDIGADREVMVNSLRESGFIRTALTARVPGGGRINRSYWHCDAGRPEVRPLVSQLSQRSHSAS